VTDFLQLVDIVIWPLVVVAGILFLASKHGQKFLQTVLTSVRRIKAFGVELELGDEEDARKLKLGLEDRFRNYREEVIAEFDRQAKRYDIGRLLAQVVEEVVEPTLDLDKSYRCTIYVEDIVFEHVLYRLLDYYPGGDGRGRIYSSRFGIIGRSWRLGESQAPTEVPYVREDLINTWGMTREEAASQQKAKWYATYLLREGESKLAAGLLYIESSGEISEDLLSRLDSAATAEVLTAKIEKVMESMRGRGPYLEFFDG
jgi:hypothetical protein